MPMTGGQITARMIKRQGIDHIFTLSGLHIAGIYAGCVEEGVRVIDTRHEQAAAHAADAYARLKRSAGVAVVTAGPGVTDAVTGVANAFAAGSPVILLGGAAPTFNRTRGALQEIEQVGLFTPITKWADSVPTVELIPSYLSKAFRVALTGRPGPVFLEMPWDVIQGSMDDPRLPTDYVSGARPAGDPAAIARAVDLIERGRSVAVVAGSSIWWEGAWDALRAFVEKAQAAVYLNGAGRGAIPHGHPNRFTHTRRLALSRADTVVVIGTPLDFRLDYGRGMRDDAALVQIEIDPSELGRNRGVQAGVWGDARLVLGQITAALGKAEDRSSFLTELRSAEAEAAEKIKAAEGDDGVPIHHSRLAREISEFAYAAGRDPIFIADGGNFVAMAAKSVRLDEPGRWLDPGPLGCLGVGAPFAIAAKLLHPSRTVIVLQGDGSFGLNGFDFESAVRFKLPMVVVVGNDASWGQIRLPQVDLYTEAESPATTLAPTRYDRVVEAFGGYGELVTEPAQIRPALERAVASNAVACVNVMLDPQAPVKAGMTGYAV